MKKEELATQEAINNFFGKMKTKSKELKLPVEVQIEDGFCRATFQDRKFNKLKNRKDSDPSELIQCGYKNQIIQVSIKKKEINFDIVDLKSTYKTSELKNKKLVTVLDFIRRIINGICQEKNYLSPVG